VELQSSWNEAMNVDGNGHQRSYGILIGKSEGEKTTFKICVDGGSGELRRYSDWLRAGRSGDRISVGTRFSTPVQAGPGPTQPPVQWIPSISQGLSVLDVAFTTYSIYRRD
jgi:hypothetical protein